MIGLGRIGVASALLLLATVWTATPAAALDCSASEARRAVYLSGEVGGAHAFRESLDSGWTFALLPADDGYRLRLFDAAGRDLTRWTPPRRGPNARDLAGWHFRSADNSAPNRGEVNAPQSLRLFLFDPSGQAAETVDPESLTGRGWLELLDYGLADLEPGQRARMVYAKFHACLTWPGTTPAPEVATVTPELREIFAVCGLGQGYELAPLQSHLNLTGDFDGDGVIDQAALVRRLADGKRAVALCRAGTRLELVGLEQDLGELQTAYFDRMTWWGLHPLGPVGQGAVPAPPPRLFGDAVTLGKDDSSSVLLYWTPQGYRSYWQGD
ncbi:MAG: hypothetical protein Kilf2KO_12050 [Rhodospirillales bacterium]